MDVGLDDELIYWSATGRRFDGMEESDDRMNSKASGAVSCPIGGLLMARNRTMGVTSVDRGCYIVVHQ